MEMQAQKQNASPAEGASPTRSCACYRPNVDILENAQGLTVYADMPGVRPENIDINYENGALTIHGRAELRQRQGTSYLLREYGVGDYHRSFRVGEQIDPANIKADYQDGTLKLFLPKGERAKPKKISVQPH